MFQTLKNAWSMPELRKKILYTLFIILIFRFGSCIPVPFIDTQMLARYFEQASTNGSMLGYLDMFSGGGLSRATIFAMSITPYINASIILQLLTVAIPALEVPNEVIEKRMTGRRVCLRCGATYHVEANPPRVADVCDICGDKLVIRSDDQADVVRHRLETYHEQTEPLKGYYDAQGKLKSIDGTKGIHETEKFAVEALGL